MLVVIHIISNFGVITFLILPFISKDMNSIIKNNQQNYPL